MNAGKPFVATSFSLAVLLLGVGVLFLGRRAPEHNGPDPPEAEATHEANQPQVEQPIRAQGPPNSRRAQDSPDTPQALPKLQIKAPAPAPLRGPGPAPAKPPPRDPLARFALSLVGEDPDAESYWIAAINDSSLSAQERQDLIEDLNEDGLGNPDHPTLEDLPLIVNRIDLVDELAPLATDKINADAFQEARKDLVEMAGKLTGRAPAGQ